MGVGAALGNKGRSGWAVYRPYASHCAEEPKNTPRTGKLTRAAQFDFLGNSASGGQGWKPAPSP